MSSQNEAGTSDDEGNAIDSEDEKVRESEGEHEAESDSEIGIDEPVEDEI